MIGREKLINANHYRQFAMTFVSLTGEGWHPWLRTIFDVWFVPRWGAFIELLQCFAVDYLLNKLCMLFKTLCFIWTNSFIVKPFKSAFFISALICFVGKIFWLNPLRWNFVHYLSFALVDLFYIRANMDERIYWCFGNDKAVIPISFSSFTARWSFRVMM